MFFNRASKRSKDRKPAYDPSADFALTAHDLAVAEATIEQIKVAADQFNATPDATQAHNEAQFSRLMIEYEALMLAGLKQADEIRVNARKRGLTIEPRSPAIVAYLRRITSAADGHPPKESP